MKKTLASPYSLRSLFHEYGMDGLDFVTMNIGYDGKAYFLFSSGIPERIDGMFVNTEANAKYSALAVTPSWGSGAAENVEKLNFGKHRMNFHFLSPLPDGSFLLLGSRCRYSEKEGPEKNAVFVDRAGHVLRALTFGDGIADCIVRRDGIIVTSYFDEGIYGNYGWEEPIGSCGVCAWRADGRRVWQSEREIDDCYAVNFDESGNLWYYYYCDFPLVRTDFRAETCFEPGIEGANRFAVAGGGRFLIIDGGYDENDKFSVCRLGKDGIEAKEPLEFVREDGSPVRAFPKVFRGTKALVMTAAGAVCYADFSDVEI